MKALLDLIGHYGLWLICGNCLLESIGLPLPTLPMLLVAGAMAAVGQISLWQALLVALLSYMAGDALWYTLGRRTGVVLLRLLCRISVNQDTCVIQSSDRFYRRGRFTLVFAKFLPGLNTLAPPLAGILKLPVWQFAGLDALGAFLYTAVFMGGGYLFSRQLAQMLDSVARAQSLLGYGLLLAVSGVIAYRVKVIFDNRHNRNAPRVDPAQVWAHMQAPEGLPHQVLDVRSYGYYEPNARRIPGSIRFNLEVTELEIAKLQPGSALYVYCTCPNEGTSVSLTRNLRARGFDAYAIRGGFDGWRRAGLAVEEVPEVERLILPSFADFRPKASGARALT